MDGSFIGGSVVVKKYLGAFGSPLKYKLPHDHDFTSIYSTSTRGFQARSSGG